MTHNIEIENAVLGAIILEPHCLRGIQPLLKEELFYEEKNQAVYRAIMAISARGESIDMLTVCSELKTVRMLEFVGGAYYVSSLTTRMASAANIQTHVYKLNEWLLIRELVKLSDKINRRANEPNADCFELIEEASNELRSMLQFVANNTKHVGDVFNSVVDDIQKSMESPAIAGVPSGLTKLDQHTGGWQDGTLIVLAARPGMGKTACALQFAKYPAIHLNKAVAVFSLEMTAKQLVGRLAASESEVSSSAINQKSIGHAELQRIGARCHKLIGSPIYIDDTPNIKMADLRIKAIKLKMDYDIKLLIVDYLQLMHGDLKGNREQEISYITRGLKTLSKELEIPVIALSQLSREVERRDDKRPQLSDLRESGAIEQDADIVAFLWRPEYYDLHENGYEYKNDTISTRNLMIIDIAKGREIKTGEIAAKFYGEYMIVSDYEQVPESESINPLEMNTDFLNQ